MELNWNQNEFLVTADKMEEQEIFANKNPKLAKRSLSHQAELSLLLKE